MSRVLSVCSVLLIFGVVIYASYSVGRLLYGRVLRPQPSAAAHSADETSASPAPSARTTSPSYPADSGSRLAEATRRTSDANGSDEVRKPKPEPDIFIEVKPKEPAPARTEPSEPSNLSSPAEGTANRTEATPRLPTERDTVTSPSPERAVTSPPVSSAHPKPRRDRQTPDAIVTHQPETPAATPQPERTPPPRKPKPAPATPKTNSGNVWHQVQVGAFDMEDNARNLAAALQGKGYHAFTVTEEKDGKVTHRVIAGAFKDKQGAERLKGELEKEGYPAIVR